MDHHNIPVPEKLQYLFTKTQGTYKYEDAIYIGELIGGKPHGSGCETFLNEDTYEGQYVNGMRHGKGVQTSPSKGFVCQCRYRFGVKDGICAYRYREGSTAVGVWIDGSEEFVSRWWHPDGTTVYNSVFFQKLHGHCFDFRPSQESVVVYTYDAGEKQGKGKKYTYKEQVD